MDLEQLQKLIGCPSCHGPLKVVPTRDGFLCNKCDIVFPIRDNIPVLLIDEAISFKDWKKKEE